MTYVTGADDFELVQRDSIRGGRPFPSAPVRREPRRVPKGRRHAVAADARESSGGGFPTACGGVTRHRFEDTPWERKGIGRIEWCGDCQEIVPLPQ